MNSPFHSIAVICLSLLIVSSVAAREGRELILPNAMHVPGPPPEFPESIGCITCHMEPDGGEEENPMLNPFGERVRVIIDDSTRASTPYWGAALAAEDSDGDGFTNGEELGDPQGILLHQMFGQPTDELFMRTLSIQDPEDVAIAADPSVISNPGNPDSTPPGGGPTATPTEAAPTETPTPTATPSPTATEVEEPTPTNTAETEPTPDFDLEPDGRIDALDLFHHLLNAKQGNEGRLVAEDWFSLGILWFQDLE